MISLRFKSETETNLMYPTPLLYLDLKTQGPYFACFKPYDYYISPLARQGFDPVLNLFKK